MWECVWCAWARRCRCWGWRHLYGRTMRFCSEVFLDDDWRCSVWDYYWKGQCVCVLARVTMGEREREGSMRPMNGWRARDHSRVRIGCSVFVGCYRVERVRIGCSVFIGCYRVERVRIGCSVFVGCYRRCHVERVRIGCSVFIVGTCGAVLCALEP